MSIRDAKRSGCPFETSTPDLEVIDKIHSIASALSISSGQVNNVLY